MARSDQRVLLLYPSHQVNLNRWLAAAGRLGIELAVLEYCGMGVAYPTSIGPVISTPKQTVDVDEVLELISDVEVDGIVPYNEPAVRLADGLARRLCLPHDEGFDVEAVRDKNHMRQALRNGGLHQPATLLSTKSNVSARSLTDLTYPVIVKPIDALGSVGVRLCNNSDETSAAIRWVLESLPLRIGGWLQDAEAIVEEVVAGPEYSTEVIAIDDDIAWSGITGKARQLPHSFDELGGIFPANIPPSTRTAVEHMSRSALKAVGIRNGVCHIEFRLSPSGPCIIELAGRVPGPGIPQSVEIASGVLLEQSLLSIALGQPRVERLEEGGAFAFAGSRDHFANDPPISYPPQARLVHVNIDAPTRNTAGDRATQITELVGWSVIGCDERKPIEDWLAQAASDLGTDADR